MIDKNLFGEDEQYLLNFQYLPDSSAKPWNYYSIKQKMMKSEISFRENDAVDKYIQSTIAQSSRLKEHLAKVLTVQQWFSVFLLCIENSRIQGIFTVLHRRQKRHEKELQDY